MTDHPVVDVWYARSYAAGPAATLAAHRACVRALLARALGRRPDEVELRRLPGGKPVLSDGSAHLSVTHTGDHLLIAVTSAQGRGGPLGVDAERSRQIPDVDGVARLILSPVEIRRLAQVPPAARHAAVLRAWTRKEALLKADGIGLALGATGLEVDFDDVAVGHGSVRPLTHSVGQPWHLYDVDVVSGLTVALATTGPARVRVHASSVRVAPALGGAR